MGRRPGRMSITFDVPLEQREHFNAVADAFGGKYKYVRWILHRDLHELFPKDFNEPEPRNNKELIKAVQQKL